MIPFLTVGIILGLSAGFSPGPLLALVISETIKHNLKAGIKVAVVPLITDFPIVLLTIFFLAKLSDLKPVLGGISILGGLFILYMGYENLRSTGVNIGLEDCKERSFRKGIIANILSPYPYLFWFSVGAPTTINANEQGLSAAFAFVAGFYMFLVGSKIAIAFVSSKSRSFLTGNAYIYTMRVLGVLLFGFALFLFHDGLKLFGIL